MPEQTITISNKTAILLVRAITKAQGLDSLEQEAVDELCDKIQELLDAKRS